MRFRKLRIAWSVEWGIACVLLIVLWIHTYWYQDRYWGLISTSQTLGSKSWHGWTSIEWASYDLTKPDAPRHLPDPPWQFGSRLIEPDPLLGIPSNIAPRPSWMWEHKSRGLISTFTVALPTWLPLAIIAGFVVLPWLTSVRRFSLRTLLIATTLVAVVLGLIVWLR
jgi:hypothetical protein